MERERERKRVRKELKIVDANTHIIVSYSDWTRASKLSIGMEKIGEDWSLSS